MSGFDNTALVNYQHVAMVSYGVWTVMNKRDIYSWR